MILKSLRNNFTKALIDYYPETEIASFFHLLSEHILRMQRIDIAQNLYAVISGKKHEKFLNALDKLRNHVPIQYIIGNTEFYNLTFKVDADTLIPRPETEELVAWIINDQKNKQNISILDVGTGSGCIAIALAKNLPNAKVFALDISEKALKIAKQNAIDNEVNVEFFEADIFDFDFEKYSLSKEDFKDLMYEEIMLYHSDEAAFNYIKAKKEHPGGALHEKYGSRLRKAYKGEK